MVHTSTTIEVTALVILGVYICSKVMVTNCLTLGVRIVHALPGVTLLE